MPKSCTVTSSWAIIQRGGARGRPIRNGQPRSAQSKLLRVSFRGPKGRGIPFSGWRPTPGTRFSPALAPTAQLQAQVSLAPLAQNDEMKQAVVELREHS